MFWAGSAVVLDALLLVRTVARAFGVAACATVRWLFGCDIAGYDDKKQGYSHFSWFFSQFVAQSVVLGVFEYGNQLGFLPIIAYIALSLFVWVGIVLGLRAPSDDAKHGMDRGSVMYGRLVLVAVTLLWLSGIGVWWKSFLKEPLDPRRLTIKNARILEGKTVVFESQLSNADFADTESGMIPENRDLLVSLSGKLSENWRVDRINGFILGDHEERSAIPVFIRHTSVNPKFARLRKLGPAAVYVFEIKLVPVRHAEMTAHDALLAVKENAASVIVQTPR